MTAIVCYLAPHNRGVPVPTQNRDTHPQDEPPTAETGRPTMSHEELDRAVAEIIHKAPGPLSLRKIEAHLVLQDIDADTYDAQRSVHRLIEAGRARLTPHFLIAAADAAVE
jgi:hypothetical protein